MVIAYCCFCTDNVATSLYRYYYGFWCRRVYLLFITINSRWKWHFTGSKRSLRIGKNYALSAMVFYLLSFGLQRFLLDFLWPAITLTFLTLGYLGAGASIFKKNAQGEIPFPLNNPITISLFFCLVYLSLLFNSLPNTQFSS